MLWSSGVKNDDRNKAMNLERMDPTTTSIEHLGFRIVYAKRLEKML